MKSHSLKTHETFVLGGLVYDIAKFIFLWQPLFPSSTRKDFFPFLSVNIDLT